MADIVEMLDDLGFIAGDPPIPITRRGSNCPFGFLFRPQRTDNVLGSVWAAGFVGGQERVSGSETHTLSVRDQFGQLTHTVSSASLHIAEESRSLRQGNRVCTPSQARRGSPAG